MKAVPWLLLCLFGFALPASAQPGPLLVILLPGTSLRDWQAADAPHLHQLMATGALAMMNTRTARLPNERTRETPESALLTLGAGARAVGSTDAAQFFPTSAHVPGLGASAGELYLRRVVIPAPAKALVNLNWPQTLQINRGIGYDIHLGNLADSLLAAGITVKAGGGHYADLMALSESGSVLYSTSFSVQPSECLIWDAGSKLAAADRLLGIASAIVTAQHDEKYVFCPVSALTDPGDQQEKCK